MDQLHGGHGGPGRCGVAATAACCQRDEARSESLAPRDERVPKRLEEGRGSTLRQLEAFRARVEELSGDGEDS